MHRRPRCTARATTRRLGTPVVLRRAEHADADRGVPPPPPKAVYPMCKRRPVRRVPSAPIALERPLYGTERAGRETSRPARAFSGMRDGDRFSEDIPHEVHSAGIGPAFGGTAVAQDMPRTNPQQQTTPATAPTPPAPPMDAPTTPAAPARSRHAGRPRGTAASGHQSAAGRTGHARRPGGAPAPPAPEAAAPTAFGSEELSALFEDHQGSLPPVAVKPVGG